MSICGATVGVSNYNGSTTSSSCVSKFGCPEGTSPDVTLKRHDTYPPFKVKVEDCDGAMDLTDENLILEVSIWAKAKLKYALDTDDTAIALADNIGFEQIIAGDIIVMDRVRLPEYMLVLGFDEQNSLIHVQRGYHGTNVSLYKKGSSLRIFRNMNMPAKIETVTGNIIQEDGSTKKNQVLDTYLTYNWDIRDSCTPGCYWLEFKLLRMKPIVANNDVVTVTEDVPATIDVLANDYAPDGSSLSILSVGSAAHGTVSIINNKILYTPTENFEGNDLFTYVVTNGTRHETASVIITVEAPLIMSLNLPSTISDISFTPSNLSYTDFGCFSGVGVDWVRRFPSCGEGFLLYVSDSPTAEL